MYFSLDRRCGRLLEALSGYDDYVTIDFLSNQLGQSRRSTQYDLCKINEVFKTAGVAPVESRRNKGVRMLEEHKAWWDSFTSESNGVIDYIFTQRERVSIMICESILSTRVKKVDDMAEKLKVSRNTIFLDLKIMKEKLKHYGIDFTYVSKFGYSIRGDPLKALSTLMYHVSQLYPLMREGFIAYLSDEKVMAHLERLRRIERELCVSYQQRTLEEIAVMLKFFEKDLPLTKEIDGENLFDTKVFEVVRRYYPERTDDNNAYLSIFLLGARSGAGAIAAAEPLPQYKKYAENLVGYFERFVGIELESKEQLVFNLARHLNGSIYRYRYGLIESGGVCEQIEKDARELFALVKLAADEFSKTIGYLINDSEVAYLTIYFAAHMRRHNVHIGKIGVLLVTKDGGAKLAGKIDENLPMLRVIGVTTPDRLADFQGIYQIVISTHLLKYRGFYVYITRSLDGADKKKILDAYLSYRMLKNENAGEKLYQSIKKHIHKDALSKVKKEIDRYFLAPVPRLLQLLDEDGVQCAESIGNWRDALAQAALPLLERGSIDSTYIDSLIMNVELYGCYTYFGNGVYLAHAKSRGNVRHSGVAVLAIKKGVCFRDGHTVRILIVIASADQYEHFTVLKEAVRLCNDESKVRRMLKCKSEEALYQMILEFSDETRE